jgi:hypothetical protein
MDNYVGILVNASVYNGIVRGKTLHECLPFYEDAGKQHGVVPCYFRLQDLKPGRAHVRAYVKENEGYKLKSVPIPRVIHNRGLYFKKWARNRIDRLAREGKIIFNYWNRYGKLKIHDLLMLDPSIRPHLPGTKPASVKTLKHMMENYDSLIIKPNSGSIGRGIMIAERKKDGWTFRYPAHKEDPAQWKTIRFKQKLPALLIRKIQTKKYIVQQRLPLALYRDRPFDLRVSLQRGRTGEWGVSGIAGKVAKKDAYVTNVAQGGTVYPLSVLLAEHQELDYQQVYEAIVQFSLRVADQLSQHLPNMADIGLDIGLSVQGYPLFIECNGRDLRYSFQEGGMLEEWRATYANPIGYAAYLLEQSNAAIRAQ